MAPLVLSVAVALALPSAADAACLAGSICVTQTTDAGNAAAVGSFSWAIAQANAGGNRTISFDTAAFAGAGNTLTLTGTNVSTPRVRAGVTIDGSSVPGLTIDGTNQREILFIRPDNTAVPINVAVRNVTLANGRALGGNGGRSPMSGGGGMGAGGAIYVGQGARLTAENVNLRNNLARGGTGGQLIGGLQSGAGGGGLNGGLGADHDTAAGSGGGGGGQGAGANAIGATGGGPTGGVAGTATTPTGSGGIYSGGGGANTNNLADYKGGAGGFGGGGGGGSQSAVPDTAPRGGRGGFGGGGGGGSGISDFGPQQMLGGDGGFGAGGGGGYDLSTFMTAGPGFGGGPVSIGSHGGSGAGFGGAIFVEDGGVLVLAGNGLVTGGVAEGGVGAGGGSVGMGLGTGFFLHGTSALAVSTGAGQVQTIHDTIASDAFNLPGAPLDADPARDGLDGGVVHSGAGTLVLRGANTYAGGTTVHGGLVNVAADTNLGRADTPITLNGGGLQWGAAFDTTRRIAITGPQGVLHTQGFDIAYRHVIDGPGALVKQGTGVLTLTGANTYAGGTRLDEGTLSIAQDAQLGAASGGVTFNGGTLRLTSAMTFGRALTFDGRGTFEIAPDVTVSSDSAGAGGLTKTGAGRLTLTGTHSYTGGTTVAGGVLQLGNGGTTGSVVGDIVNNGALVFNRSDALDMAGVISGSGTLTQSGSGVLNLLGASTYTGLTRADAGVLAVNGSLAGPAQVHNGATLRGTGTVGGPVEVVAGRLAPGNSPGTLSVGALVLNATSHLDYELGLPGLIGNGVNDLTRVAGDLTLDGTLNLSNLGGLSAGVYRIFDYAGTLTNNGLAITAPPAFAPGDFLIETGTPGQVNLIVLAGGALLQYWDGPNTTANNVVDGGTGTWDTTTTNWTGPAGAAATPWNEGFAVFQGTAGVVTLSQDVAFEGMQFRSDGYLIQGSATLAGEPEMIIRVDPLVTATINAPIVDGVGGPTRLVRSDGGRLVLGGANTYSGGTAINGGDVQVGSDANLGAPGGGISLNDGILFTSASFGSARSVDLGLDGGGFSPETGTTLTLTGAVSGPGVLYKFGLGTVVLEGDNSHSGGTFVGNGVLAVTREANLGAVGSGLVFGLGTLRLDADLALADTRPITLMARDGGIDTNGHTGAFAQSIGGSGGLVKRGSGTLVLTGDSTFAGGTTISGGTLQLGSGGSTGSVRGPIVNNAALVVDRTGTLTLAGVVSGTGTLAQQGTGTLTLTANNTYSGGTTITAGTLQLGEGGTSGSVAGNIVNNAALVFDRADTLTVAGAITGTGSLDQRGPGTTVLSGASSLGGATAVTAGTLAVAAGGSLATPTVSLRSDATLAVAGTVQAAGATATTVGGDAGANAVTVAAGGTLRATGELGAGVDTLDVAGTLDTGAGTFALGEGEDTFTVHDGTVVTGTVDGGGGADTRAYVIDTAADVGALLNFEGLRKDGTGVLNLTGPGSTALTEVEVLGGTLNVGATGAMAGVVTTTVAAGATLNVDGSYGGSAGRDTMTVAGTVDGAGALALGEGDDRLVLRDGAVLANAIDGGAASAADILVLDSAVALSVDTALTPNFEHLFKYNTGVATLVGAGMTSTFSGDAQVAQGTLAVAAGHTLATATVGVADAATVQVEGTVAAAGGGPTRVLGDAGASTVRVAAGGTLVATGELGAGADVLDVAGTLDTGGGAFGLGEGDDTFTVHDGTAVLGSVDGGAGNDTRDYVIHTSARLGALLNFESLRKDGAGVLTMSGPAATSLLEIAVVDGTLDVAAGAAVDAVTTTVASGATLAVAGRYTGTAGRDTMAIAGTVAGAGTVDLLGGDDTLTLLDGADLGGLVTPLSGGDGTDTVAVDIAGTTALGAATAFETLAKSGLGTLDVLGPAPAQFATVHLNAGTLAIGPAGAMTGVGTTTVAGGATLAVAGRYTGTAGRDTMTVAGTVAGAGTVDLLDGDDTLTLLDGADLDGLVAPLSGGAGADTVAVDIAGTTTLGATLGFETLDKSGAGTLNVLGPAPAAFATVNLNAGTVAIGADGAIQDVVTTTVADGATLAVAGAYTGTAGNDAMTVAGTVTGAGAIDLRGGDDTLTVTGAIQAGGAFALGDGDDRVAVRGGRIDRLLTLGAGRDAVTLDAAAVTGIDGGAQDDTFVLQGPTVSTYTRLDGGADGSVDTLVLDPYTLVLDAAEAERLRNFERVAVTLGSVLDLASSFALGDAGNGQGTVSIDASSVLSAAHGPVTLGGGVDNAGLITLGNGAAQDTLTLSGDYVGQGGVLLLDTVLGADDAATDRLIVQGSTAGATRLGVVNAGGAGAASSADGIRVVQVDGASHGQFALQGRAVAGLYEYLLHQGGRADPGDGDWYLRSALLEAPTLPPTPEQGLCRPEPGAYLGNQSAALALLPLTRHDRDGGEGLRGGAGRGEDGAVAGWVRAAGGHSRSRACQEQLDIRSDRWLTQVGAELQPWQLGSGRLHVGAMGGYGRATTHGTSRQTQYTAVGRTRGYTVGVYGTWAADGQDATGPYVDVWLMHGSFDHSVEGQALPKETYDARAWASAVEAGYGIAVSAQGARRWYVEPQLQAIYAEYDADDHREANGTRVATVDAGGWQTRLGVRLYGQPADAGDRRVAPFAAVNWWHAAGDDVMSFNDRPLAHDVPRNRYELQGGVQLELGGAWTGWGSLSLLAGEDHYRQVEGQIGARYSW